MYSLLKVTVYFIINGPRVTFGIFDGHMLKKGILSNQTT